MTPSSQLISWKDTSWDLDKDLKQAVRFDSGLIFITGNELKRKVRSYRLKCVSRRNSANGLVRHYEFILRES